MCWPEGGSVSLTNSYSTPEDWTCVWKSTFDLMVRSERLAAAAAIFKMSGLLFDFMISERHDSRPVHNMHMNVFECGLISRRGSYRNCCAPRPLAWVPPVHHGPAAAARAVGSDRAPLWPVRCSAPCRCPYIYRLHIFILSRMWHRLLTLISVHSFIRVLKKS